MVLELFVLLLLMTAQLMPQPDPNANALPVLQFRGFAETASAELKAEFQRALESQDARVSRSFCGLVGLPACDVDPPSDFCRNISARCKRFFAFA